VDQQGKLSTISFVSRQLDNEKKYSLFLLEAAAAIHFKKYLKGKKFILYMDHKPLENWATYTAKGRTGSRWPCSSIILYKKGSDMPANYLV